MSIDEKALDSVVAWLEDNGCALCGGRQQMREILEVYEAAKASKQPQLLAVDLDNGVAVTTTGVYVPQETDQPVEETLAELKSLAEWQAQEIARLRSRKPKREPSLPVGLPEKINQDALSVAMLTLRPQVWRDHEAQALAGEIPLAQIGMKTEMWSVQFRPYLERAILTYLAQLPERESGEVVFPVKEMEAWIERFEIWACQCSQLLDGWHADGTTWSEWDETVRKELTGLQKSLSDLCPYLKIYDYRRKSSEEEKP